MAINEDGNEIGKVIDADTLLTQIAKARLVKAKPAKKAEAKLEAKPRPTQRAVETKKA
jgi:hypothetical protein